MDKNKKISKILLLLVSIQTIIMGILFIVQILRIYFLNNKVFADSKGDVMEPVAEDVAGFEEYMKLYVSALEAERKAVETIKM